MAIKAILVAGPDESGQDDDPLSIANALHIQQTLQGMGVRTEDCHVLTTHRQHDFSYSEDFLRIQHRGYHLESVSAELLGETIAGMRTRVWPWDALVVFIKGHGRAYQTGSGKTSHIRIGQGTMITPSNLEDMLSPIAGHQLLVTSACEDFGFGELANAHRVVVTRTNQFAAARHHPDHDPMRQFFRALGNGDSYRDALQAGIAHYRADPEWGACTYREVIPALHATPQLTQQGLAAYKRLQSRMQECYGKIAQRLA